MGKGTQGKILQATLSMLIVMLSNNYQKIMINIKLLL